MMPHIRMTGRDGVERVYEVPVDGLTIGRSASCDITLKAPGISRSHLRIGQESGQCFVEDTGSHNGVIVNGERTKYHWLRSGDIIELPHNRIQFQAGPGTDGDIISEDLRRSAAQAQEPAEAGVGRVWLHPYAAAAAVFMTLAVLHWAFAAASAVMGIIAVRDINVKGRYFGKFLAIAAMCGAAAIVTTDALLRAESVQRLFTPDPLEQRCHENMEHIWMALKHYERNHDGRFPDELSALYPDYIPVRSYLSCPGADSTEHGAGYKYIGSAGAGAGADTPLLADAGSGNHRSAGALLLFGDGRIERVSAREYEFLRLRFNWIE